MQPTRLSSSSTAWPVALSSRTDGSGAAPWLAALGALAGSLVLGLFLAGCGNDSTSPQEQDEDVLDTWASSWIWPISVFDGFEKPDGEIRYYYPTNVLVTGETSRDEVSRVAAGGDPVLFKPVQPRRLFEVLKSVLG